MPIAPAKPALNAAGQHQALFRTVLQQASAGGAVLMARMVEAARVALQAQENSSRDPQEREAVATAANQLRRQEQFLCAAYPKSLEKSFSGPMAGNQLRAPSMAEVQFHQLELMDEVQVQTSVGLARIQQLVLQAAESSLSELNTLMCSLQGMATVRAEFNPMRPENYINALTDVVGQTGLPNGIQLRWFNAMSSALGPALDAIYLALCSRLRTQGVTPGAFAVTMAFGTTGGMFPSASASLPAPEMDDLESAFQTQAAPLVEDFEHVPASRPLHGRDPTLLTLDKLRRLLVGELGSEMPVLSRVEQFAQQFAQQFEGDGSAPAQGPRTEYDDTVPAALLALTEMKQVDRVVQSLEQRRGGGADDRQAAAHSIEGQRQFLRQGATGVAQALSLEVVTLMVDNMARDPRLLGPVSKLIRNLEPALLRLALVDPRFFTDKQHPARRLLHELTDHSLAFDSSSATGFDSFIKGLEGELAPLSLAPIESADVFEAKLVALQQRWSRETGARAKEREVAVDVLSHAEARNLLAEKIARGVETHRDSAKVPGVVTDFLCGPWAQVVAEARIKRGVDSADAKKFDALIPAMLWSAHPELARSNPSQLSRVVPRLLTTLREGLETIKYPATRTSVFLEALMAVHQKVFRANMPANAAAVAAPREAASTVSDRLYPASEGDPWVAPEEARVSNFVEFSEVAPGALPAHEPQMAEVYETVAVDTGMLGDLPLGNWVELLVNGQWTRTQLTWASPHGTLFLFTGAFGATQSMTRRSRDKLLATGKLRLLSGQSVDEGALNAVVQTAMRNSVDSIY